jgi:hypothetical protein
MCAIDTLPTKGDQMEIEIEEDGTVTIRTAGISGEVHKTAEEFIAMLTNTLGAEVQTHQHKAGSAHVHHGHTHTHNVKGGH